MKNKMSASMFQKEQVIESIRQSFVKLNPRMMIKNPIMFTVEVVTVIMLVVTLLSLFTPEYGTFGYNLCVCLILFVTLLFANFAEAIAEARGKAQADSLRKTREETPAKLVIGDKVQTVSSSKLKKGDVFVCERRIIWQNVLLAFGVKLLVLILGASGIATLWEAVFADVGVTLIAIMNAVRIQKMIK